jgi:hypothetical protein
MATLAWRRRDIEERETALLGGESNPQRSNNRRADGAQKT